MDNPKEDIVTTYSTKSTSNSSSKVSTIILNETKNTRRTLMSNIVKKPGNPEATVKITIINERIGENGFEASDPPDLRKLKSGECHSCALNSADTLALYRELSKLYALGKVGIGYGKNEYVLVNVSGDATLSNNDKEGLSQLLQKCHDSPGLAENLAKFSPNLIENAYHYQVLEKKYDGIAQFKTMLKEQCKEQEWQIFFKEHDWILGGVHDIQYLSEIIDQPVFSGPNVEGSGKRRGDFLVATQGSARFTAIVEIKKANTPLLKPVQYRQTYCPSDELNGGLALNSAIIWSDGSWKDLEATTIRSC